MANFSALGCNRIPMLYAYGIHCFANSMLFDFAVATDMVCWMPVCIISLLRLCGVEVHLIVHGLTGEW